MPTKTIRRTSSWRDLSHQALLDVRLCDLDLSLKGTWVEERIQSVLSELRARDLRVRPSFWISEEWFCPEGTNGIALPFFLIDPKLMRLEKKMIGEVEGGTKSSCAKLLRHEVGHVVDQLFRLHNRTSWRKVFGNPKSPYPQNYYHSRPGNKDYVQYLDYWYAQSHPLEDFAETFAVWLDPRSNWRRRYQGWGALAKLEYVDRIMQGLRGRKPEHGSRKPIDEIRHLDRTLANYYEEKQAAYGSGYPDCFDDDLLRLFSANSRHRHNESAAAFVRRNRGPIRQGVLDWLGEHRYTVDHVLREMIGRLDELGLRLRSSSNGSSLSNGKSASSRKRGPNVGHPNSVESRFSLLLTVHAVERLRSRDRHPM